MSTNRVYFCNAEAIDLKMEGETRSLQNLLFEKLLAMTERVVALERRRR